MDSGCPCLRQRLMTRWHALLHLLGNLPTGGRGGRRASGPHVVTARRPLRPPRRRPPAPTRPSAPPPIERGPFHRRGAPTPHPRRRGGGAKESHAMESLWQPSICVVIEFSRMITKTKATAVVQAVAARRAGRTAAAGAMRSFYGASQEPCWARGAGGGGAQQRAGGVRRSGTLPAAYNCPMLLESCCRPRPRGCRRRPCLPRRAPPPPAGLCGLL